MLSTERNLFGVLEALPFSGAFLLQQTLKQTTVQTPLANLQRWPMPSLCQHDMG
jgi:hypothetical protein